MDIIKRGTDWFEFHRNRYCVEPVLLVLSGSKTPLLASVVVPETEGKDTQTYKYVFLFKASKVSHLDLRRGGEIIRSGTTYEIIRDKQMSQEYNDPHNQTVAVAARIKPHAP